MFTNCKLLFVLNLKRVVTDNTEDIFITMGKHDQLCTSECKQCKHDREGVWPYPSCR